MTSLPSSIDVAIIGAGAAGIGAARALEHSCKSVLVLEARDRVGGRAHTIQAAPDIIFDRGCGWLHSADENSFVAIADALGFVVDKTRPPWREQSFNIGFPADERAQFMTAIDAFYARVDAAAKHKTDSAAADYLEPGNRWNPMLDALSTYINGAELDRVSVYDLDAYEDTEVNWRVRHGYGALVAAYAKLQSAEVLHRWEWWSAAWRMASRFSGRKLQPTRPSSTLGRTGESSST